MSIFPWRSLNYESSALTSRMQDLTRLSVDGRIAASRGRRGAGRGPRREIRLGTAGSEMLRRQVLGTPGGEPRTTFDVDVVVAIAPGQIGELLAALSADPQFTLAPDEFALTPQVTIVHAPIVVTPSDTKQPEIVVVDFLVVPPALSESILRRAISIDVAGSRRNVCTPEDLILLKLLSARIKDREDVRLVLAAQSGRLDIEYVTEWTATLGVEAEWQSIRGE